MMYKAILSMMLVACFAIVPQGFAQVQDDDEDDLQITGDSRGTMAMGGMGGMGGCGTGMWGLNMLNLNPDQTAKVNKIHDELLKQNWAIKGKIIDDRIKLRDLYQTEPLDSKKIIAVYDDIFNLRKQMIEGQINAMNQIRTMLTPEQQQQLKQFSGRCGPMNGMGSGPSGRMGRGPHGGMGMGPYGGMSGGPMGNGSTGGSGGQSSGGTSDPSTGETGGGATGGTGDPSAGDMGSGSSGSGMNGGPAAEQVK